MYKKLLVTDFPYLFLPALFAYIFTLETGIGKTFSIFQFFPILNCWILTIVMSDRDSCRLQFYFRHVPHNIENVKWKILKMDDRIWGRMYERANKNSHVARVLWKDERQKLKKIHTFCGKKKEEKPIIVFKCKRKLHNQTIKTIQQYPSSCLQFQKMRMAMVLFMNQQPERTT